MDLHLRTSRFRLWMAVYVVWLICVATFVGADTDVGNIAVIEADPTIIQPGELFDLNNRTLTFTPRTGGGYTVSVGALAFDTNLGTNLALGNDASASRTLSFSFPFFGSNRTSVFINANGNLTFSSGSTLTHFNAGGSVTSLGSDVSAILDRIAVSLARIAVLWQDWNPAAGGGVFANALADRLLVTWNAVPLSGTSTTATFQVVLFSGGVIQMNYKSVPTTPGGGYLVGISPGVNSEFLVTTLNFSQGGASISAFPNQEPLVQVFGSNSSPLVHISAVARRFFRTHADLFDQLVMFANFTHAMGDAFAFELTARQTNSGTGVPSFNLASLFGSAVRLQSFLNMNRLSRYPGDPNANLLGTNTTLDIMGQEAGHMWLAHIQFDNGGVCSSALLGRDLAHWSFFHDTDASDMEGNKWRDNGNGKFTTIDATQRYSALDQYIMGLRSSSEVPSFFFINADPKTLLGKNSASPPEIGVTVTGTRQDVTLSQVVTCAGARSPSSGFSGVNPSTTWKQAFILLIPNGTTAPQTDLTKIDTIRAAWVPYFTAATGGRGAVDTTLSTANDNTPPDITITAGPTGTITGNSVIFTWAGTDNLTSTANLLYAFRLDPLETSFSPVGSATSKTYTGLADGTYTFFVKARDQAGNEALMPASRTFTVDTTPPDTALTAGPTGTIRGNSVTFTWTGTDTLTPTASLLYAFRLDPLERTFSPLGSATSKTYTGLANGSYTFFVKAMDQAGNEDPTPASRGFSVAVPNLSCAIQMSQAIYVNGDTVTASVLRLTALDAAPVPVELKLWFDVPGMAPLSFVNVGAQGDIQLPAGFDQNFGPLPLAPVTPELPPGSYAFNCRIFDPVTGQLLSEDLNPFAIDPPSSNLPVPGDMATSVPGPACEIQLSQSSYANGDTLTAATLRIVNPSSTPLPIELKLWFEVPGLAPISFISLGGMGDVQLPVGFDQNFGPLPLATVTPAFPRGAYAFNCRIFDPVTGQLLSEDLNAFVIP